MSDGSRFFAWFDETVKAQPQAMREAMEAQGYGPHHTGGGCMAYSKTDDSNPEKPIDIMFSADDCLPESLTSPCIFGFYDYDGHIFEGYATSVADFLSVEWTLLTLATLYRDAGLNGQDAFETLANALAEAENRGAVHEDEREDVERILKAAGV